MRKWIVIAALLCLVLPAAWLAAQPAARLEASAINTDAFPTLTLSLSVLDSAGQPVRGLTASDFTLTGDAAAQTQIVSVEEVTDDNLPLAVVLAIDVSSSMLPSPIERAKAAAQAFVDSLRPQDSVAILTFGTNVSVEQSFTTDRAALSAAIARLQAGGQTALYQGAFEAVNLAATAPVPRRAVILLGDGAEFGERSLVTRAAALDDITRLGVPVYTIGLGFGADRTYLQALAQTSSARFYESPTPDELAAIYADLSALFRSQYLVTLETGVPGDGTVYTVGIETSAAGGVSGETSFRAPINTPIVRINDAPTAPVTTDTSFTIEVLADQPLASVTLNDEPLIDFASPYSIPVIPFELEPGERSYTVRATDADGDSGETSITVEIAALPPDVIFSNLTPGETLDENRTVGIAFVSQTPVVHVAYFLDGRDLAHRVQPPWDITLNVEALTPGEHTLRIIADNAGGAGTFEEISFVVAESVGLTQTASAMPTATATHTPSPTQPTATHTATATRVPPTNTTVPTGTDAPETLTATPLPQGEGQSPTPTVGTRSDASATLTPASTDAINGVPATATPTPTPDTAATAGAQASQTTVQVALDALAADATATTEAQASATQAEVTAVAQAAIPTATPVPPTIVPSSTPDLRATANAQASQTAAAQNATSTINAQVTQTAVAIANANATATANIGVTQTVIAQATQNAQATSAAIRATANAQATATQAALNQQATAQIVTGTAQAAATRAAATQTAVAQVTNAAEATSVQVTAEARETRRAVIQITQTADLQLTTDARATAVSTVVAAPTLTSTPVPTRALVEVDAQSPPATADFLPLICVVGAIAGILAIIFVLLGGRRRRERR
ncbi:MAG: VWA domain-containing protein [Chloroflexota bacterium]|nr:VWA domain-containing protein [Chloroflexota bacterium]